MKYSIAEAKINSPVWKLAGWHHSFETEWLETSRTMFYRSNDVNTLHQIALENGST